MSRAAFYEVFDTHERCLADAFDDTLARLSHVVQDAVIQQAGWLERLRAGLVALLGFFDDEPQRARLLVLDAPVDAATGLEWRRRLQRVLARLIDAGRGASVAGPAQSGHRGAAGDRSAGHRGQSIGDRGVVEVAGAHPGGPPVLTTELVVGGVLSLVRTGMLEADATKLVELAPSLMAFIVTPYLGPAAARLELEGRPARRAHGTAQEAGLPHATGLSRAAAIERTATLPIRVTHRTTLVLRAIAQTPYANNREIARVAGITDEGQASKLLARLAERGVIENVGIGPARGEPNAWLLTAAGRRAVEALRESQNERVPRRTSRTVGGTI